VSLLLDEMTAMQVREAVWGHPHHPAAPHELAAAVAAVLRGAMPTILASKRR
jgi:hypothetical protein